MAQCYIPRTPMTPTGLPIKPPGGGGAAPGGGGTQDVEWIALCDNTGVGAPYPFLRRLITDTVAGTTNTADFERDGVTPYVVIGTASVCGETEVLCEELVDDVLGDGTGALIPFYRFTLLTTTPTGARTYTPLGDFSDERGTAPYTVVGTAREPNTIGQPAIMKFGRDEVSGGTWKPRAMMAGFTITVEDVSGGDPTFTDSYGVVSTLVLGEVLKFENNHDVPSSDTAILSVPASSRAVVSYTEIGD